MLRLIKQKWSRNAFCIQLYATCFDMSDVLNKNHIFWGGAERKYGRTRCFDINAKWGIFSRVEAEGEYDGAIQADDKSRVG